MKVKRCFAEVKGCFRLLSCLLLCSCLVKAQSSLTSADEISFERDWPAQATPYYRVTVQGDGSGTVATSRDGSGSLAGGSLPLNTAAGETAAGAGAMGATKIHISSATLAKLFAVEPVLGGAKGCETGSKKLAQTGKKTLVLRRDGKMLACTFNYSDERRVQDAVNAFGAIEQTVEEGPRLVHLRRFDRLGLDAEIGSFTEAVKAGRAIELGNIAEVLRTLAGDGDLMERVRNRATDLLAMADAGK